MKSTHNQDIIEVDVEVDENLPINEQILMAKLIEAAEIDPTEIVIPTTKANKDVSRIVLCTVGFCF